MHKKHTFRNKRIDNWLLKLQDILPQIIAIKYRKGIDNGGPDFLTRYEPLASSLSTSTSSSSSFSASVIATPNSTPLPQRVSLLHSFSLDSDWPSGTETWDPIILSPVVTRSKTSAKSDLSHPASIHQPSATFLPDVTPYVSSPAPTQVALSRDSPPSPNTILDLSLSRIKIEQHSDPDILSIITRLRTAPSDPQFALQDDVLFRVLPHSNVAHSSPVPFLPKSLVSLVLHAYHDHPLSGHFGVHRTVARIRTRFWWPRMRQSVQNYIASCTQCVRHNIVRTKLDGHLKSLSVPSAVFQVVHMDFWGPVRVPSSRGNCYVIILTDNLSKYVIAAALPDCSAKSAAQFFTNNFILIHGAPERLITDNGTHFNNHLLQTITTFMNIAHAFSISYHPQTNGQVERFNATFASQIAKFCGLDQTDWDVYLPSVVFAYNTSVHSVTKFIPYELAFGRSPKSPFDSVSPTISLPPAHLFHPYLQRTRRILTAQARANILHSQSRWQQRYNHNRRDPHYRVNDLVYVQVCAGRTKLDARWLGPCTVIHVAGQQNYLVRNDLTGRTDWYHVSQLHPVVERHSY